MVPGKPSSNSWDAHSLLTLQQMGTKWQPLKDKGGEERDRPGNHFAISPKSNVYSYMQSSS